MPYTTATVAAIISRFRNNLQLLSGVRFVGQDIPYIYGDDARDRHGIRIRRDAESLASGTAAEGQNRKERESSLSLLCDARWLLLRAKVRRGVGHLQRGDHKAVPPAQPDVHPDGVIGI